MLIKCLGNKTPFRGVVIVAELNYKAMLNGDTAEVDQTMANQLIAKYGTFEIVQEEPKAKKISPDYSKKVVEGLQTKDLTNGVKQ